MAPTNHEFALPSFPFASLVSDTPSSTGSASTPHTTASHASTSSSDVFPRSTLGNRSSGLPSTFLPSYYPESRHSETLPSLRTSLFSDERRSRISDVPSKSAETDPSGKHLLDGIAISPPRPPRTAGSPTFKFLPDTYSREPPFIPRPWSPEYVGGWNGSSFIVGESDEGGGGSSSRPPERARSPQHRNSTASGPASSPNLQPQQSGGRSRPTSSPMPPPPSPYNRTSQPGLTYPSPQLSSRQSYGNTGMEPMPYSANYPGMLFGSIPLAETVPASPSWGAGGPESRVSSDDYAQALTVYEHILAAIPHIRTNSIFSPPISSTGKRKAQTFDSLVQLATEGLQIISGQSSTPGSSAAGDGRSTSPQVHTKRPSLSAQVTSVGEKVKPMTKCLGCGATETPEWRRGPMGPRTLCNACGLVHMKLQRKRRKMEEKAAAAAAASNGDGG